MDYTLHEWVRMASHHGSIARCAIEKQAEESGLDALEVREKMRHHLRVMQEAAQQGTEKGRELLGDAAGIENFHNAAPKTENTRHGEAQFHGGLGAVQGGRGHRVQISGAETAEKGEDHHACPNPRHCHIFTTLLWVFAKKVRKWKQLTKCSLLC